MRINNLYAGQILITASGGGFSPFPISLVGSLTADAMKTLPVCQSDPVSLGADYIEIHTEASPPEWTLCVECCMRLNCNQRPPV